MTESGPFTTVKATLQRRVALADWRQAFERWAATRPSGSVALARLESGAATSAAAEPEPDIVVQTSRIWLEPPSRWRHEVDVPRGVAVTVVDGPLWWSYAPSVHALSNESAPTAHPPANEHPEWQMLHPREVMRGLALKSMRVEEQLGRSVEVLEAVPDGDADPRLPPGADAYEFAIDRARGIALRIAARWGDREFWSVEITDIEYDAKFGVDVFRLTLPPGVSFTPPPAAPRVRRPLLQRLLGR